MFTTEETPLDIAASQDVADIIHHALGRIREEYREVILLREYDGLSYAEIATVTGDTVIAVKSRIFKARKELGRLLTTAIEGGRAA